MDVVEIEKTDEHFRLMYDQKGRFVVHRITGIEAQYKLCKVIKKKLGDKGVSYAVARLENHPIPGSFDQGR